ncbi:MAG: elongator complex protein 4 [Elusimicrobiales bacterium]|nr:elongator complex protein 4 [Elusimicrobiales bacterium]
MLNSATLVLAMILSAACTINNCLYAQDDLKTDTQYKGEEAERISVEPQDADSFANEEQAAKEISSGTNYISESNGSRTSISLDGEALNKMLPGPASIKDQNKETNKKKAQNNNEKKLKINKKNVSSSKEGTNNTAYKTKIPKMKPVKGLKDLFNKKDIDQNNAVTYKNELHELIFSIEDNKIICKCKHHICTPEARLNNLKMGLDICCPVFVWNSARGFYADPLPKTMKTRK